VECEQIRYDCQRDLIRASASYSATRTQTIRNPYPEYSITDTLLTRNVSELCLYTMRLILPMTNKEHEGA
jgi:hypothetical protein